MMRCKKVKNLLSLYLDNELPLILQQEIEGHLKSCGGCAKELKIFQNLVQNLKSLPPLDLPIDFSSDLHRRLVDVTTSLKPSIIFVPRYAWAAGVFSLLLLLSTTLYYFGFIKPQKVMDAKYKLEKIPVRHQMVKKRVGPKVLSSVDKQKQPSKSAPSKLALHKKEGYRKSKKGVGYKKSSPRPTVSFLPDKDILPLASIITQPDISLPFKDAQETKEIVIRLDLKAEEGIDNFKIELTSKVVGVKGGREKVLTWQGDLKENTSTTVLMPMYAQLGEDMEIKVKVSDRLIQAKVCLPEGNEIVRKITDIDEKEFNQIMVMSFIPFGKISYSPFKDEELKVNISIQTGIIEFLPLAISRAKMIPNMEGKVELVADGNKVDVSEFQMVRRY